METQFFILGHMILYVMCMLLVSILLKGEMYGEDFYVTLPFRALGYFIPLQIIYWILHWIFV